jgi:hypothetical protein
MNRPYGTTALRKVKTVHAMKRGGILPETFVANMPWTDRREILAAVHNKGAVGDSDFSGMTTGNPMVEDFTAALRPLTVFDRIGGRQVPFNRALLKGATAAIGYWIGQSKPIPISRATWERESLDLTKVGAIVVVPDDVLADPSLQVEARTNQDIISAAVMAIDRALLDPSNSGSDSTPAAITANATPITSTGSTLSAIDTDLKAMIQALIDAGSSLVGAKWVLHPRTATYLSMLRGTGGALAYPAVSVAGGELAGLPVLVTANAPLEGSPADTAIILVDGNDFVYADEGAELSLSNEATVEMSDEPTGATDTPVAMSSYPVSLFQESASALLVVRHANWMMRRNTVAVLTDVDY